MPFLFNMAKQKSKSKQLILLKVSDPSAGDDRYGLPKIEKFDIKMLRGNTIYNYKDCYIKSLSAQAPELVYSRTNGYEPNPSRQDAEITIGADYFTMDYGDYSEIEHFNRMFDLNINATTEPSDKDKPKVVEKIVEKIVEKEVVKVEYVSVVVVPPTYREIVSEKYDFYKKLI